MNPVLAPEATAKRCLLCAQPPGPNDYLEIHADQFHLRCFGELISDPALVLPLALHVRTREFILSARHRLRLARAKGRLG